MCDLILFETSLECVTKCSENYLVHYPTLLSQSPDCLDSEQSREIEET